MKPLPTCVTNRVPSAIDTKLPFHTCGHPDTKEVPHETMGEVWVTFLNRPNLCWQDATQGAIGGNCLHIHTVTLFYTYFILLNDLTELIPYLILTHSMTQYTLIPESALLQNQGVKVLCLCVLPEDARFGSCEEYVTGFARMKTACTCGLKDDRNKHESYHLRTVKNKSGFKRGFGWNNRTVFIREFPMRSRGVFLVIVNHDHCVVFDASRQPALFCLNLSYKIRGHNYNMGAPIKFAATTRILKLL